MSTNGEDQGDMFRTKTQVGAPRRRANAPGPTDTSDGNVDQAERFRGNPQPHVESRCNNIDWKMWIRYASVLIICAAMLGCYMYVHQNMHTEIDTKLSSIKTELGDIKNDIAGLKRQLADLKTSTSDQITSLKQSINAIERKLVSRTK